MTEQMDSKRIRVLVVDDYAVVRSSLMAFLSACDDLEPVGEAANGADAVRLCGEVHPDVVLMDMVMPGMDGVAATRLIHLKYPHIQVVALTGQCADETVRAALEAGALSYLLKNISPKNLAAAIRAARDGQPTLAPEAMQAQVYMVAHQTPAGGP
jgi:NarL family two-component system response regulator LiaR